MCKVAPVPGETKVRCLKKRASCSRDRSEKAWSGTAHSGACAFPFLNRHVLLVAGLAVHHSDEVDLPHRLPWDCPAVRQPNPKPFISPPDFTRKPVPFRSSSSVCSCVSHFGPFSDTKLVYPPRSSYPTVLIPSHTCQATPTKMQC